MCRLFGLIANKEVDVRFSMLEARNRFKNQGKSNPDGWGIGWYENNQPRIEKYGESAFNSNRFNELSKEVKSKVVIAHVRFASSGSANSNRNAHPFVYDNWIFAHNGTINKMRILGLLRGPFNIDFISEPIDSEVYFRYVIQCIEDRKDVIDGIKTAIREVIKDSNGANFILSNGKDVYAFRYGKQLYFLKRAPSNPLYGLSKETQALIESKKLLNEKAVLIATEKLTDENWKELSDGELLEVNKKLSIRRVRI